MQFTNRAEKLSRTSDVFFGSISKLSIEIHKRRPCLNMFLWNYRVLIWQYYQKFRQRSDIYAECLETTIKLYTFHKNFLNVHVWMTLKHFWNWAKIVCLKGPKLFCSKSEIRYENIFPWPLVLPQNFIWRTNIQFWTRCQKKFLSTFEFTCKFKFFERFYLPENVTVNMYNAVLTTLWKVVRSIFEFYSELQFTSVDLIFLKILLCIRRGNALLATVQKISGQWRK